MTPTFHRLHALVARIDGALLEFGWLPKTTKYVIDDMKGRKIGAVIGPRLPADSFENPVEMVKHAASQARLSVFKRDAVGAPAEVDRHYHIEKPSDIGAALKKVRQRFGGLDVNPRAVPKSQWRKMLPGEAFTSRACPRLFARFPAR